MNKMTTSSQTKKTSNITANGGNMRMNLSMSPTSSLAGNHASKAKSLTKQN